MFVTWTHLVYFIIGLIVTILWFLSWLVMKGPRQDFDVVTPLISMALFLGGVLLLIGFALGWIL